MSGPTRILTGTGLLAFAALVALEASGFRVGFLADPLGPAAFPLLGAGLVALGGAALVLEGLGRGGRGGGVEDGSALPDGGEGGTSEPPTRAAPGRVALATGVFVTYAAILEPLGFVLATTLTFAALARLFGGRLGRGLAAGLAFALVFFAVFVYGLGLPLPVGVGAGG